MPPEECEGRRSTKRPLPKKRTKVTETSNDNLVNTAIKYLSSKSNDQKKEEDTEEKFGRYIASELRSIKNEKSRQMLKLKIQQMIMMEQIGGSSNYNNQHNHFNGYYNNHFSPPTTPGSPVYSAYSNSNDTYQQNH